MITAIEIENFKGISGRIRIDVKPITLLFGANSSGKSTIIHALHYAREVFVRGNIDAGKTETGGDFVDLGGFRNFVHNHDPNKQVALRFHLSLENIPEIVLPYFGRSDEQSYLDGTLLDRLNYVSSFSVEIKLAWSHLAGGPFVSEYRVDVDRYPFAVLTGSPEKPGEASLHVCHQPSWLDVETQNEDDDAASEFDALRERVLPDSPAKWFDLEVEARRDALPDFDLGLSCPKLLDDVDRGEAVESFMNILNRAIVGPGRLIHDALRDMRYLGPLRNKPARNYEAPRFPSPARWANGIAAWDSLYRAEAPVLSEISDWLSSPKRLSAGCWLRVDDYKELSIDDPLILQLIHGHAFDDSNSEEVATYLSELPTHRRLQLIDVESGTPLLPQDVGEGISQVIPVVVAVLTMPRNLTLIEQPELHVHPRVQVGLGDLLIERARDDESETSVCKPVLIETHSEHLMLRLLRRIRETADGELPEGHPGLCPEQLSVVFVEQSDDGVRATALRVDETGEFIDRWPQGFFGERAEELF